jgi:Tol biopolymer transport system component
MLAHGLALAGFPGLEQDSGAPVPSAEATFRGENGKIAFDAEVDGHRQIFVIDADGSNQTQLTDGNADNFAPAWSPSGTRIAFVSDREEGIQSIWSMNADGSDPVRQSTLHWNDVTTPHPTKTFEDDAVDPAWRGDGQWITFARRDTDGLWWVWITSVDNVEHQGDGLFYLCTADLPPESCRSADWSPVEDRFLYVAESSQWDLIRAAKWDGSDNLVVAGCQLGQQQRDPNWSPDGKQIVFSETIDGNADIYVVDVPEQPPASGSNCTRLNPRRLTDDPASDVAPVWSPDGQQIAFSSDRDGGWQLYTMSADGSNVTPLSALVAGASLRRARVTAVADTSITQPAWQPKHKKHKEHHGKRHHRHRRR